MFLEAAEYGDSSATYWTQYLSEAEISDQKLVDTVINDTTAISVVVSGYKWASKSLRRSNLHAIEWHFRINNREFHHTNISVSSAKKQPSNLVTARSPGKRHSTISILSGSLSWGTFRSGNSVQYLTTHQFLPGLDEHLSMRSCPAMVLRIHEVRPSPCGPAQARARTNVSTSRL